VNYFCVFPCSPNFEISTINYLLSKKVKRKKEKGKRKKEKGKRKKEKGKRKKGGEGPCEVIFLIL
jgi:hypothetical protein